MLVAFLPDTLLVKTQWKSNGHFLSFQENATIERPQIFTNEILSVLFKWATADGYSGAAFIHYNGVTWHALDGYHNFTNKCLHFKSQSLQILYSYSTFLYCICIYYLKDIWCIHTVVSSRKIKVFRIFVFK